MSKQIIIWNNWKSGRKKQITVKRKLFNKYLNLKRIGKDLKKLSKKKKKNINNINYLNQQKIF